MALNQIGAYAFDVLDGPFLAIGEELVIFERPGVDGTAAWRTGQRGREFKATSEVACTNLAQARTLYLGYRLLIATFVDVIWCGLAMSDANNKYLVKGVEPTRQEPHVLGVGGVLVSPSYAYLVCEWTLQLVNSG